MNLGIVGSEAAKFTMAKEALARNTIKNLIEVHRPERVVSGGCHLGGIDAWAAEIARKMGVKVTEHLPKVQRWYGGYRDRNILIAQDSDIVVCITVKTLPKGYHGMRFTHCYHCKTNPEDHIKSGGCWTMKHATELGKEGKLIIL